MQLWRLGLLLFLMSPAAFAVEPADLTLIVPAVAVVVGIFLALSSMLATAIADPRFGAWARTELREFVAGLILIALITAFFVSSTGISIALTGETDYVQVSQEIIDGWIENYDTAYANIIRAATKIRAAATYSPYINIPIWYFSVNYSTNPLGGVAMLLGSFNFAVQGLTNAIFISEGIRLLVSFVQVTVPKIILPLSFVLRLIPFTRRLGNTLIAISIAALVFLPFSIILADELNKVIVFPDPKIKLDVLDANPGAMVLGEVLCESKGIRSLLFVNEQLFSIVVCSPLLLTPWTAGLFQTPCRDPLMIHFVYPLIQFVFQMTMSAMLIGWEVAYMAGGAEGYAADVFAEVQPFLTDVSNLVLVGYLDFILIGIVTLVGARSLSAALGGEWYMAGIQRLI